MSFYKNNFRGQLKYLKENVEDNTITSIKVSAKEDGTITGTEIGKEKVLSVTPRGSENIVRVETENGDILEYTVNGPLQRVHVTAYYDDGQTLSALEETWPEGFIDIANEIEAEYSKKYS